MYEEIFRNKQQELEGSIRISPSQVYKFFDKTYEWYREQVLKEEQAFKGNQSSFTGTLLHGYLEVLVKEGEVNYEKLVEMFLKTIPSDLDIDTEKLVSDVSIMKDTLVQYLVNKGILKHELKSEFELQYKLNDKAMLAGTIDLYDATTKTLIDLKTTAPTSSIKDTIPRNYWFQLMSYWYLLNKNGYEVDKLQLLFVSRPELNRKGKNGNKLKDYPTLVKAVNMIPTSEDVDMITGIIELIGESVEAFLTKPELRHIIAQDIRLKIKQPKQSRFRRT